MSDLTKALRYLEKKIKEKNPMVTSRFSKNSKAVGLNLHNDKVKKAILEQLKGNK